MNNIFHKKEQIEKLLLCLEAELSEASGNEIYTQNLNNEIDQLRRALIRIAI